MAIRLASSVISNPVISTGTLEVTGTSQFRLNPSTVGDDSFVLFELQGTDHFKLGIDDSVTNDPLTLVRGADLAANKIWSVADNSDTFNVHGAIVGSSTIDATTDFTIGDTVITNGVITDSTGLQLAANLDINGTADISGDLTLSAGADGALQFTNAGENSIKIPDNQASALII